MAGKSLLSKPAHRFFSFERENPEISDIEFDESDVWNSTPLEHKKQIPSLRFSKKSAKRTAGAGDREVAVASSLPVNIPDWSKILGEGFRGSRRWEMDEEFEEEDSRIPPHEFLAKQFARAQIASFSVHEGVGRTLKGRDLSRVRNAVWQKTGFED